jgi:hypothetical protein
MEYNALALSNGVQRFSFVNQKTPKAEALDSIFINSQEYTNSTNGF